MRENVVYDDKGRILKAGGIIINNENEILLYKNEDFGFSFPKGHCKPGETLEACAHREVKEETGLDIVIIDYLPPVKYRNTVLEQDVFIEMFLMKPLSKELAKELDEDVLVWVDFETAVEKLKPSKDQQFSLSDYLVENKGNIYRDKVLSEDGTLLKAGAIIYRDNGKEILLTYRNKWKDYSYPKGHMEPGETFEEVAKREALEESGCEIKIVRPLPDLFYEYPESGDVCVKMFLAECVSQSDVHEDFEQPVWVKREEVIKTLTYKNMKDYFRDNVKDLVI